MWEKGDYSMKFIDRTQISPPPESKPASTIIPLSFLDIPWLLCRPVQRLFFYDNPECSVTHFTDTALPSLKRSLSVALQKFYPLAGGLANPPQPKNPYILYCDCDSVPFIAAVSHGDFAQLTSDLPQPAALLHHLYPPLPPAKVVEDDGTAVPVAPLLAVQVTLFPNSGICIGVQFIHVVADGMAINHFIKTWASICKADLHEEDASCILSNPLLPVLDRTIIEDPNGLKPVLLKDWWNISSTWEENSPTPNPSIYTNKLRATFVLTRGQVDRLKSWIYKRIDDIETLHLSTFVVTCAYIWSCLIKAKEIVDADTVASYPDAYPFCFMANCRGRLGYPDTYFGNCLGIYYLTIKRDELLGPHGIVSAAKAIGAKVMELEEEGGLLEGAERWLSGWQNMAESGCLVVVAGSPSLRVYDTDFGWGRPRRSRVVQVDGGNYAFSFGESHAGEGGVEVGLALGRVAMDAFCSIFEQGLDLIYC